MKKILCKLRQSSFTDTKKCTFTLLLDLNLFLPLQKKHITNDLQHWNGMSQTIFLVLCGGVTFIIFLFRRYTFFNAMATILCPYLARPPICVNLCLFVCTVFNRLYLLFCVGMCVYLFLFLCIELIFVCVCMYLVCICVYLCLLLYLCISVFECMCVHLRVFVCKIV